MRRAMTPSSVGRWFGNLLVPLLSYVASTALTWFSAALAGVDYWTTAARWRWDSEHYLSIASRGYESFRCVDRYPDFPDVWCGNTAWFPGYPLAIRGVAWFGIPDELAAVLVSELSFLAALVILWGLLGGRRTPNAGGAMALAAVFPGGVYFHAIFPISLCLLGLLILVAGVRRESWWLAGLGGFVALSTHMVGAIGLVALAASLLFGWRRVGWPGRLARVGGATALGALAYPASLAVIRLYTGSWTIYFQHQQDAYGQGGLKNPLEQIVRFWGTPFWEWYPLAPDATWLVRASTHAHQSQLVVNLALVTVIAVVAVLRAVRRDLTAWEAVAALIALGAVAMPLVTGTATSWYRHGALMLVALAMLRLPRAGWVVAVVVCAVQAVFLGAMWFGGSLV